MVSGAIVPVRGKASKNNERTRHCALLCYWHACFLLRQQSCPGRPGNLCPSTTRRCPRQLNPQRRDAGYCKASTNPTDGPSDSQSKLLQARAHTPVRASCTAVVVNRHCCQLHSPLGAEAAVDVKQEDRVVKREEDQRLLLLEDENLCLKRRIFELEDQLAEQAETIQAFQTSSAGFATHRALQ